MRKTYPEEKIPTTSAQAMDPERLKTKENRLPSFWQLMLGLLFLSMAICLVSLATALTICQRQTIPNSDVTPTPLTDHKNEAPKSASGKYRFGAVAADNRVCSEIGTIIMGRHQGSVVDAAIATLLCIGAENLQSAGIGGGFFMTIYDNMKKEVVTLDSREVAPAAASVDMFVNRSELSTLGGLSVAVPGEIAGYAAVHARYGRLPWRMLFEPTIKLCRDGFVISEELSKALSLSEKYIRQQPGLRQVFLKDNGSLYEAGDVIKLPRLAHTLQRIADEGPDTFYNGSLAHDIVADIQESGGVIVVDDLSTYGALWKEPVEMHLANGDYTLYGPRPPSSAVVLNYILSILDGYNISTDDTQSRRGRILLAHRMVEAMKFGYGKRTYLGDDRFVNVTQWIKLLQTASYADQTRQKINDDHVLAIEEYDSAGSHLNDGGTSHLAVYGPDGSAVSVTSTINTLLGSKILGNRTGILFNNEMGDFSTPGMSNIFNYVPSDSNYIAPGKRPMSSMSPTIVLNKDRQVVEIVGASGGSRIISGTLEVIVNTLWLGLDAANALDQPRFHHQHLPNEILYEKAWPIDIQQGLAKKGHQLVNNMDRLCVVQVITNNCQMQAPPEGRQSFCINAASDVRKGGFPDGF